MKKFLLFAVAVLVGFVVGASEPQRQIKVPDSLPIGTSFPPAGTMFNIMVGSVDQTGSLTESYAHTNALYTQEMGKIEDAARNQIDILVKGFVPLPGTETLRNVISLNIEYTVPEIKDTVPPLPIGWSHGSENIHQLVKVNGKWTFPSDAVEKVVVGFQDLSVYVRGLSEVTLVLADEQGKEYSSETSQNGITDKTCSQYPGGSAYLGPDFLEVSVGVSYPPYYLEQYEDFTLPRGYYLLKFGADKAIWAKYDLQTGLKLASNEPPVPLTLAISLVQLDDTGKITLLSKKSLRWGLKLSVSGPMGKPASIEYADTAVGGQWTPLTKLSMTYGSGEFVEPVVSTAPTRFYRVR